VLIQRGNRTTKFWQDISTYIIMLYSPHLIYVLNITLMSTIEKEGNEQNLTIFEEYREIPKQKAALEDYYFRLFNYINNAFSDDLPDVDVRTLIGITETGEWDTITGSGIAYKCQGNYIIMFGSWIRSIVEDSLIQDSELIEEINYFFSHNFSFTKGEFTSKEEINLIKSILNGIITNLSVRRQSPTK